MGHTPRYCACDECRTQARQRMRQRRAASQHPCANCDTLVSPAATHCRRCFQLGNRKAARYSRDVVAFDPVTWLPEAHPVITPRAHHVALPGGFFANGHCDWCETSFTVYTTYTIPTMCSDRCVKNKRRARRGRFVISPPQRLAIYLRDAWTCQLCFEPVDPQLATLNYLDHWAPTLDHIVPQSKGGDHTATNLRLAHRWCNAVRSDDTYYTEADLRPVMTPTGMPWGEG